VVQRECRREERVRQRGARGRGERRRCALADRSKVLLAAQQRQRPLAYAAHLFVRNPGKLVGGTVPQERPDVQVAQRGARGKRCRWGPNPRQVIQIRIRLAAVRSKKVCCPEQLQVVRGQLVAQPELEEWAGGRQHRCPLIERQQHRKRTTPHGPARQLVMGQGLAEARRAVRSRRRTEAVKQVPTGPISQWEARQAQAGKRRPRKVVRNERLQLDRQREQQAAAFRHGKVVDVAGKPRQEGAQDL